MKINCLALLFISLMLFSCDKAEEEIRINQTADYIVFGNVLGLCTGDCRRLFLLDATSLRADADTNNPQDAYDDTIFQPEQMEAVKFQIAQPLLEVPEVIFDNGFSEDDMLNLISDTDVYVLGNKDGQTFELKFDNIHEDADPALIEYANMAKSIILQIQ